MKVDKVLEIAKIIDDQAYNPHARMLRLGSLDEREVRKFSAESRAEEILARIEAWSVQG